MGMLNIETCTKKYGVSSNTLRRWIKRNLVKATLENNQWLVDEDSLVSYLQTKGIEVNPALTSVEFQTKIAILEKENEFLKEQINLLNQTIQSLKEEREFLRGQLQQLTNTINILTTRQLPEPKGFIDRIKGWFRK